MSIAADNHSGDEMQEIGRMEGIQVEEEIQMQEADDIETQGAGRSMEQENGVSGGEGEQQSEAVKVKKKREKKEPVILVREVGKSLLPFSRVQKIIKADKDIPIIARDATFLISIATEEFIKRLCEAGKRVADRERRATVQHKDIATVVRKADEFMFLEEIIPWATTDPLPKRKPKAMAGGVERAPTLLDQFIVESKDDAGAEQAGNIVMNDDGTMFVADTEFESLSPVR